MCRSIKTLREGAVLAPADDVRAAALQFVRKVSGYRQPSAANREAFERAVDDVALAAAQLRNDLVIGTEPTHPRIGLGGPAPSPAAGNQFGGVQPGT